MYLCIWLGSGGTPQVCSNTAAPPTRGGGGGDGMNYVSPVLLARPAVAGEAVGRIMLTRIIS